MAERCKNSSLNTMESQSWLDANQAVPSSFSQRKTISQPSLQLGWYQVAGFGQLNAEGSDVCYFHTCWQNILPNLELSLIPHLLAEWYQDNPEVTT